LITAQEKLNGLKSAITAATRAMARKHALHVEFGQASKASDIALPPLPEWPSPDSLSYVRGVADHAALNIRHHDPALHRSLRPTVQTNGMLFDVLEAIRVETLGSQHMHGVRHNLYRRYEQEALRKNLRADKLAPPALVELYARRYIQELPIPAFLSAALDKPVEELKNAMPLLDEMRGNIDNQRQFAGLALKLIERLAYVTASLERGEQPGGAAPSEEKSDATPDSDEAAQGMQPPGASSGEDAQQLTATPMIMGSAGEDSQSPEKGEEASAKSAPYPFNYDEGRFLQHDYHAYTTQYDQVVLASELATASEFEYLRRQLDQRLSQFQSITARLASRLQRLLLATQARRWIFDEEEGTIDSRKLTRVIIHPDYQHIYKREQDTEFRDTVVTLLIDNSGSMRGRPITMAALSADIISRTLERCDVKVEILGFTTREWKGGQTYKQWMKNGKPGNPGRLNDLRHIIYKPAEASWRKSRRNMGLMLKDGILKENIDGEAILWACERLLKRPEQRRILMVISDGAPVDDSTLSANGGNYLDRHLREVIAHVENQLPIELVAIGIGHDVTRYYKRAVTISDIEKLGETMTEQLGMLFDTETKKRAKRRA
jgi:cobaltochelatase CobT